MKSLPILTVIALLGLGGLKLASAWQESPVASSVDEKPSVVSSEAEPVENAEAITLIHDSRDRLLKLRSLTARVVQKANFGVYHFRSEGTYVSASDLRFRFDYKSKLGNMEGQFLEVSDGQVIHTRKQVGKISTSVAGLSEVPQIEMSRRDLQTILRARRQNQDVSDALLAADIGIGGLPAVLASLEKNLIFDAVKKETVDGHAVTIVRGTWRKERRNELIASIGPVAAQLEGLVPDQVRITFDDETLVPRQFLYLKLASEERKVYRPVLSVDIEEIQVGGPVTDQAFNYPTPQGIQERDDTEAFLQMISNATAAAEQPVTVPPTPGQ